MRRHRRNITIINNEIDYDRLAKTIIEAQQEAEKQKALQEEQSGNVSEKNSVLESFNIFKQIIFNKAESNGTMTSSFLGGIMSLFFNILALFGVAIISLSLFAFVVTIKDFSWTLDIVCNNIMMCILYFILIVVVAVMSFVLRCIANEIQKEKDRNYIIAVFSAVVAFVALVVSLIDVFKEVI